MAGTMDLMRLRDQTLQSSQDDDPVTVNTRALVDKILARYSGEWTTLRELIQNAADASATTVKIKFETQPSATVPTPQYTDDAEQLKHTFLHHTIRSLLVSNNGLPFSSSDWDRLKRIAEGNPDETKIGAFGVGFYSVFADCENPFITSGRESMAFYWKRDSLFTRKGTLPADHPSTETSFMLESRNTTSPLPSMISLCQFLSTSITFIAIENIELWVDKYNLFTLRKKSAPSVSQAIPKSIDPKTKEGLMRVVGLDSQNSQIDATWVNIVGWTPSATDKTGSQMSDAENVVVPGFRSFLSRLAAGTTQNNAAARKAAKDEQQLQRAIIEDLMGVSKATVFIRVNQVHIKTQVSSAFAAELERATKKQPPKQTKIAILTSSYDETNASLSTLTGAASQKAAEIITSILPSKSGRIFIGFPTAQTTGLGAHVSAPNLIPTVEREQVDLNARFVRTWNTELLSVAGIAARIAYSGAIPSGVGSIPTGATAPPAWLQSAAFTLKQFTFHDSTPLSRIGQIIEEAFWNCSKVAIEIPSTRGILPSNEVRFASEDLSFVERIPLVPEELLKDSNEFISKLRDFGLVTDITTSDIRAELEKQALTESQLNEFMKWASQKSKKQELDAAALKSLIAVTVANLDSPDGIPPQSNLLELRSISSYVNTSRIPAELPIPSYVIPFRLTKSINQSELQSFGWQEHQIVPWLRWLLERAGSRITPSDEDMTASPAFASQVLAVVSKNFDTMSQSSRTTVSEMLTNRTVIPTKMGMRKPPDSYFASVKLFDDLPTINGLNSVKEKFLKTLGVRKTVELAYIFERLLKPSSADIASGNAGWSHVDIIKYFQSVWNDIPTEEIAQLQKTRLCPAEVTGKDVATGTEQRFRVSDLFEPKDALRALGLPVLQWPGFWNAYSPDGKILKQLGLRSYPSVSELIDVLVKANKDRNDTLYETALKYFIENHYTHNYASSDLTQNQSAFLPLQNGEPHQLVKPADCFADPKAEILFYPILRQDLRSHAAKFGVQTDPAMPDCALRLIKRPPQSQKEARRLFGYFADRAAEITAPVAEKLGSAAIVPIAAPRSDVSSRRLVSPNQCFLGDGQDYGEIFDYVDFGTEANLFLLKIGCKHEPSITELTQLVIREPKRILMTLRTEKYKNLLYKIHLNMTLLKKNKLLWKEMKSAPFLLAIREKPSEEQNGELHDDDGNLKMDEKLEPRAVDLETRLRKAEDICIQDDLICYTIFKPHIFIAPMEELLEELYFSLGSPSLSSLVDEEARFGPKSSDQGAADVLRDLILERAQLFLHEQMSNTIRHDIKWLEKNLEVQTVQSISLRRTLRGQNVSDLQKRTAAVKIDSRAKTVLSITAKYDVWQVSQCIVGLIIDRPKTQVSMVFETFLTTPLMKLRARGYNVDRILRKQKIEQARIAEADRQRRVQEEERKRQKTDAKVDPVSPDQRRGMKAQLPTSKADEVLSDDEKAETPIVMPGTFQETPLRPKHPQDALIQPPRPTTPRGFFSTITKHLGLDQLTTAAQQMHAQNQLIPSPETKYDPQQPHGQIDTEAVTSPYRVMQNLKSAVTASRAHGSSNLFSRPATNLVKEMSSYCDTRPGHDLAFLGATSTGLRIFVDSTSPTKPTFLAQNTQGLEYFSTVILAAASVFPVPKESLHIYFDDAGTTIAFNNSGSMFFNYRFFAQLHLAGMQDAKARGQAVVYWWVTMCHELAHNLVGDHSSGHSYWTEQFVATFFPAVTALIARLEVATA